MRGGRRAKGREEREGEGGEGREGRESQGYCWLLPVYRVIHTGFKNKLSTLNTLYLVI